MDRIRRVKEKARAYFAKGRYDKAVVAWQEVVKADPRDLGSRLRLGDAYRRLEQHERAIACYGEVADFYARDGLLLKAIAACRLILEVDAGHRDTQQLLADLYARKYGHRPKEFEAAVPASEVPLGAAPDVPPAAPEVPPAAPEPVAYGEIELAEEDGEGDYLVIDEDELEEIGDEPIDITRLAPLPPPPPPAARELPSLPLFSDLDPEAFVVLLERMRVRRFEPGEAVVNQGEQGDSFFIVVSGALRVFRTLENAERIELALLGDGHFFGEMALLSDQPRSASVVAQDESELFELDRALIDELGTKHPTIAQALQRFYRQRLLSNLMATSPLFRPFDKAERRGLVQRFSAVEVPAGEAVIKEGEASDALYVILGGEVAVVRGEGFDEVTLARLHEGDVFGEMGLLSHAAATASVKALRRTVALRLDAAAFQNIMMTHPQILEVVSGLSEERRRLNESLPVGGEIDVDGLLLF